MIKSHYEQGSEAWHQEKLGRVTGTRYKDLMGTKAAYQGLLFNVASEILTENKEDNYVSFDMQNGIDREPDAVKEYESLFGLDVETVGFIIPENEYQFYIGCSPDGLVENGLIEIKSPKMNTHLEYLISVGVPKKYYWQVQGNLFTTGLDYCDFISYHPDLKLYVYREYPDKEAHEKIKVKLDQFIIDLKDVLNTYNKYDQL